MARRVLSGIGSLVLVRFKKRRELPSGVWTPLIFQRPERREVTPELVDHLVYNTCRTKINFGEYSGTPMGALPTHYLLYLANDFSSDTIHHWRFYRDMAKEVLRERRSVEISKRKRSLQDVIHAGNVDEALKLLKESCNQVDRPAGYAQLITLCAKTRSLDDGLQVHDHLRWAGFARNSYLGDLLIVMYSKCGRLDLSTEVFEGLPKRLVSSWTALARCFMDHGRDREALELYKKMDVQPDTELLVSMFECCGNIRALAEGKVIYACLLSSELRPDLRLRTAIFRFHARCDDVEVASRLLSNLEKKSVRSWNDLIQAYLRLGLEQAALGVYEKMDCAANAETFISVLSACSSSELLQSVRADILANKLEAEPGVSEALTAALQRLKHQAHVLPRFLLFEDPINGL